MLKHVFDPAGAAGNNSRSTLKTLHHRFRRAHRQTYSAWSGRSLAIRDRVELGCSCPLKGPRNSLTTGVPCENTQCMHTGPLARAGHVLPERNIVVHERGRGLRLCGRDSGDKNPTFAGVRKGWCMHTFRAPPVARLEPQGPHERTAQVNMFGFAPSVRTRPR